MRYSYKKAVHNVLNIWNMHPWSIKTAVSLPVTEWTNLVNEFVFHTMWLLQDFGSFLDCLALVARANSLFSTCNNCCCPNLNKQKLITSQKQICMFHYYKEKFEKKKLNQMLLKSQGVLNYYIIILIWAESIFSKDNLPWTRSAIARLNGIQNLDDFISLLSPLPF